MARIFANPPDPGESGGHPGGWVETGHNQVCILYTDHSTLIP